MLRACQRKGKPGLGPVESIAATERLAEYVATSLRVQPGLRAGKEGLETLSASCVHIFWTSRCLITFRACAGTVLALHSLPCRTPYSLQACEIYLALQPSLSTPQAPSFRGMTTAVASVLSCCPDS